MALLCRELLIPFPCKSRMSWQFDSYFGMHLQYTVDVSPTRQKLQRWIFLWHRLGEALQTLHGYDHCLALPFLPTLVSLISGHGHRSVRNVKLQVSFSWQFLISSISLMLILLLSSPPHYHHHHHAFVSVLFVCAFLGGRWGGEKFGWAKPLLQNYADFSIWSYSC